MQMIIYADTPKALDADLYRASSKADELQLRLGCAVGLTDEGTGIL